MVTSRKRILFVSGFLPSERVPSGGQMLVGKILKSIAKDSDVTLLAFCNSKERAHLDEAEFAQCKRAKIFDLGLSARFSGALLHPFIPLISSARYFAAKSWFIEALEVEKPDLVWIEFMQAASFLSQVPSGVRTRLTIHDFFFQAHERRAAQSNGAARLFWALEAIRTKRWESAVLRQANEIFTLTEKDKELARELGRAEGVTVRYPEVDPIYHRIAGLRGAHIQAGKILFWGQMSRRENEDAVLWFVREIFPAILKERPHAKFIIAGAKPSLKVLNLSSEQVEVTGFVQNPENLFQTAEIAVAPLRLGAGIKIKVAEFMAAAIPTVCTPIGAEGIQSSPFLKVAGDKGQFAENCISLLRNSRE